MGFYIKKLIISGPGKKDSTLDFSSGLNIIYGPSNTGKTYVLNSINYVMGSSTIPFNSTGYTNIKLFLHTKFGGVEIDRNINEKFININYTNQVPTLFDLKSGKYFVQNKIYEKTVNYVFLKLIGIDEETKIIKNINFERELFSWNTFRHLFFLTESRVISNASPLFSETAPPVKNTALLSSLLFLLTGDSFPKMSPQEAKKMYNAKKSAVKLYIENEIDSFSNLQYEIKKKLDQLNIEFNYSQTIEDMIKELEEKEKEVQIAISKLKDVLKKVKEKNENLSECNLLLTKYNDLKSQYNGDLKRLNFIIDGEINKEKNITSNCPFCDHEVEQIINKSYIESAKKEFKNIELQLKDLEETLNILKERKNLLTIEIQNLDLEKEKIDILINSDLKPFIKSLKTNIKNYETSIELKKELALLDHLTEKKIDYINKEEEKTEKIEYHVKEHFDKNFIASMESEIYKILLDCDYDHLTKSSINFDIKTMDIEINHRKKSDNGKGYRAFFNSIISTSLVRILKSSGKYSSNILMLDSPILSLEENETISDSMQKKLFLNFANDKNKIQVIVVENKIPEIDYDSKKVNLIHFTKDKQQGRYGLLEDYEEIN